MSLRPIGNVVLVVLPDTKAEQANVAGLFEAHAFTPPPTCGRVAKIGPLVADVQVGDMVAFGPDVGDPLFIGGHHCLFLREPAIDAIIPKREAV